MPAAAELALDPVAFGQEDIEGAWKIQLDRR